MGTYKIKNKKTLPLLFDKCIVILIKKKKVKYFSIYNGIELTLYQYNQAYTNTVKRFKFHTKRR